MCGMGGVFPWYATVPLPDRIEGRVDLAEMTSQPLGDARHFLSPNERLWVQILSLDHNNMRVDLSVRRAAEVDPSEE